VKARVRYAPSVEDDLAEIFEYIARDSPDAAASWIDRLIEKAEKAARAPRSGRVVPEAQDPDVREVFLKTYRIIYRVEQGCILVLAIIEGHRLLHLR
jgi:addiction module RelE/StbE family toxin